MSVNLFLPTYTQLTNFRWYLRLKLVRRFASAIALMVTPTVA